VFQMVTDQTYESKKSSLWRLSVLKILFAFDSRAELNCSSFHRGCLTNSKCSSSVEVDVHLHMKFYYYQGLVRILNAYCQIISR
jgi:hypothetical protein